MIGENCLVRNWKTTKRFFSLTVSTYKTYFFEWNHWLSFTTNLERQITEISRSKNTYNLFMWFVKKKKKPVPYHGLLFPFLFSPLKMFLIAFPRPWTARPSNNNQDYQVLPVKTNNKSRNPKKTSFWQKFYVCLHETTYT